MGLSHGQVACLTLCSPREILQWRLWNDLEFCCPVEEDYSFLQEGTGQLGTA